MLLSKVSPIETGTNNQYRHFLEVTDTCGYTNTSVMMTGPLYYNRFAEDMKINMDRNPCTGNVRFTFPNKDTAMKRVDKATGNESSVNTYVGIYSYPSGANLKQIGGSWQPDVSYETDKPGEYTFWVSNSSVSSSYPLDLYCTRLYKVTVPQIPQFELDLSNTAAYRCPGQQIGGYIHIKVKNGSGDGNYKFELWDDKKTTKLLPKAGDPDNTDGIFKDWDLGSDKYRVIAYDYGCAPTMISSFEQEITVYDLSNRPIAEARPSIVCIGDTIRLESLALGDTDYEWSFDNGRWSWTYTGRNPKIPDATLDMNGEFTLKVRVPGCDNAIMTSKVQINVGENTLYWNPAATDGDWFNTANWLTKDASPTISVPAPCTTVHIPGMASIFPDLHFDPTFDRGYPFCDTIVYHYGSETAYPSYLRYNRAKIQYNFGYYDTPTPEESGIPEYDKDTDFPGYDWANDIPRIPRARFSMLAAPLKYQTGGDFALAGYPNFYQRLFNSNNPENGTPADDEFTGTFSTANIDLSTTGHALAIWPGDYDSSVTGQKDHKYLEALQGVMEMPYIMNPYIEAQRPLQTYNTADSTSTFCQYSYITLEPECWNNPTKLQRGYKSFRFVFEKDNDKPETVFDGENNVAVYKMKLNKPNSGERIMIGNPTMGHIDFDKLYALNSSVIKNYFQIVEAATNQTLTYSIGSPGNDIDSPDIPLLQAIIIASRILRQPATNCSSISKARTAL
ncbi:MAG: hypothetical protein ACLVKO_01130 [Dysgonomonas sp.]